jgi:hypothetical protein
MSNTDRTYRVEGHGKSLLVMFGGCIGSHGRREPLLTRAGAWSTVRAMASEGHCHTIKVFNAGRLVFRAFQQADGCYIDAETCETIAA